MRRIFFVLITCVACLQLPAQLTQQFLFTRIGVKEGLAEEMVVGVQQDKNGYMWIATPGMIQRYDGQRMINFAHQTNNSRSLPIGRIQRIVLDKKNRLWVISGLANIGYITVDDFVYHSVKTILPQGILNKTVDNIFIDNQNQVMVILINRALLTYDEASNEVAEKYNFIPLPDHWYPFSIQQDKAGIYWVSTWQGLLKYDLIRNELSYGEHNSSNDPFISHFKDVKNLVSATFDNQQRLWVVAWPNEKLVIRTYNASTHETRDWVPFINEGTKHIYYDMSPVTVTREGSLWISGNSLLANLPINGPANFIPRTGTGEYDIRYDIVYHLFEDREMNLWVSTNKGVYLVNPSAQKFRVLNLRRYDSSTPIPAEVTAFLETGDNEIMVSTWGKGIFYYDSSFNPIKSNKRNTGVISDASMVWCMMQRKNKDIWIGEQNGGLAIWDAHSKKLSGKGNHPSYDRQTIRQIVEDRNGNVWLGTHWGSLVKWNASVDTFTYVTRFNGIIHKLLIDNLGQLWVVTDANGVYCMNTQDGTVIKHYTDSGAENEKLRSNGAVDMVQYDDSTMIIVSDGLNILNLRTHRFNYLTTETTLYSANIAAIVKDKGNYVWMSSAAGIEGYNMKQARIDYYRAEDGVHTNSFGLVSATRFKNGNIAFGSAQDALIFSPGRLGTSDYHPPKVQIASISIGNELQSVDSILKLREIELNDLQHTLTFELSTVSYLNHYVIYYMMDGMDKDWIQVNPSNQITFSYLPSGKYTFKTAVKDYKGEFSDVTTLAVIILPPFYKTWWFFVLVAIAIGVCLFLLDRGRMRRKESIQKMRTDIASNLHEEVNIALSNINILSEMARLKADLEPEKSKEFIEQIHTRSHNMIVSMNDMLWSISPDNDSMGKAIDRMQEFLDALTVEFNTPIEFDADASVKALNVDMQLRHEAFLLFKDSIRGLLSTGTRHPVIKVSLERGMMLYRVMFSMERCNMQQLNNLLHRQDMEKRMEILKARLDVQINKTTSVLEMRVPAYSIK